jgi:hypothetical protein
MLMDLVSNYHSDKLSDAGEKKVCMECFLILSFYVRQCKNYL